MRRFYTWPEIPPQSARGEVVLVRVPVDGVDLRAVLREILSAWTGLSAGELPLRETSSGPVWDGEWQGDALGISFSYVDGEGWIGLLRGGWIGVDVAMVEDFAEIDAVTQDYLDPLARAAVAKSPEPERAFARAWAELEARIKCVGGELREWPPACVSEMELCKTESGVVEGGMAVAVAIRSENREGWTANVQPPLARWRGESDI